MQPKILVIAQTEGSTTEAVTFEVMMAARELAGKTSGAVCTAVMGAENDGPAKELSRFSDTLYTLESALLESFQSELYLQAIKQLCGQIEPDIILLAHNLDNIDLAPVLAHALDATLITDCIALGIDSESGNLLCTKEVYGGNANAVFVNTGKPAIATLRPKGLKNVELPAGEGSIQKIDLVLEEKSVRVEVIENVSSQAESFEKADVVVAGGRGIGGADGVLLLEELIQALKGKFAEVALGGSRPAIDEGWMPGFRQIGLTGEKVNPQVYIAVGISGALQHMTGIFGSKKIVAINNNAEASIFNYADYGIVGDYKAAVASFTKKIREIS